MSKATTKTCVNCEGRSAEHHCDCGCDGDYCPDCWGLIGAMPVRRTVTGIRVHDNSSQPRALSYLDAVVEVEHGGLRTTKRVTIYEHTIPTSGALAWRVACAAWPDLETIVLDALDPTT